MFSKSMIFAGLYILGVLITPQIDMSALLFFGVLLVLLFFVRRIFLAKTDSVILLAAFFVLLGGVRYFASMENPIYYELPDKYVTARGTVVSVPAESSGKNKYRYMVQTESFTYLDSEYVTKQKILVNTDQKLLFGDKITVRGFLNEIDGAENTNEYSYANYYKSIGVYNRLTAREIVKTGKKIILSPIFFAEKIKNEISEFIDARFSGNNAAFLKAVIVGDNTGFTPEYSDLLRRTGVYRALYSAYMHIFWILLIARLLLRKSSKEKRDYAVMLMLIIYAVFNSTRAYILKAAMLLGVMLFRKTKSGFADKIEVLSEIVFVMTLIDPMLCFNSGFVISVVSTIVIYLSYSTIYNGVSIRFPMGNTKIKRIFVVWIALLFGTLPFTAYFYNGTALYGGLLVCFFAPVIVPVLAVSALVMGCLGTFLNVPDVFFLFEKIPYFIEKLPFSYIMLRTPTILEFVVFYLLWWIGLRVISGERKNIKILVSVLCSALVVSIGGGGFNTLSVYFVNVGQGDGAVLQTSVGETVLIDGGGAAEYETKYNVGERVYVPYLISHGMTKIDLAIVTHFHKDHIEGIIAAAERLEIDTVIMPDTSHTNEYREKLEEVCELKNIKIEKVKKSDEIRFKSGLSIKFIAPDDEQRRSEDLNDTSLVAEVRFGEFCGIFTGDSTDEIDESYPQNIDLLKVAHHGSNGGTSEEYLEYLNPEYAVISVGEDNSYALPDFELIERLKASGAKILRTDRMGDIQMRIKKDGKITYKTLRGGI